MLLDQQVPMERAFRGPALLRERLGGLDATELADMDPTTLAAAFSERPAIHRFPSAMAERSQRLCQAIVEQHGGQAERIWLGAADGADLLRRLRALPGFGDMKARIFVALLGKQWGLDLEGWEAASAPYGEPGSLLSVADVVDATSLEMVRAAKAAAKKAKG
jgi:uncharacterized HhH-GPD family protein